MSPKSLFSIVLKVFAILIFRDILMALPGLLTALGFLLDNNMGVSKGFIIMQVVNLTIFCLLIYFLLFRTEGVIRYLGLAGQLEGKEVNFQASRASVLTMALIVLGGLILIDALPELITNVFGYYQAQEHLFDTQKPPISTLLVPMFKILVGILLLSYTKPLVKFIERKSA